MDKLTRIIDEGRARTGLTITELCELIGMTRPKFYRHLRERTFTLAELKELANWLYLTDMEILEIIRGK